SLLSDAKLVWAAGERKRRFLQEQRLRLSHSDLRGFGANVADAGRLSHIPTEPKLLNFLFLLHPKVTSNPGLGEKPHSLTQAGEPSMSRSDQRNFEQ
ncbi:hypothetical protein KUCAC02_010093, partial [Chaenocephalus aceratus]